MGIEQEIHVGARSPSRVVVYSPYNYFIYFDDKLAGMAYIDSDIISGLKFMCEWMGVEFEYRNVRYEDWPGHSSEQHAHTKSPERLSELEEHFRRLDEEKKAKRIAQLEYELKTLKGN